MLIDKLNELDPAGSTMSTLIVGNNASTNVIDLGMAVGIPGSGAGGGARDIGVNTGGLGPMLKLMFQVLTAATSGGSPTLNIQVQGAPDSGSGTPGSYTTYAESSPIPLASLFAGARFDLDLPRPLQGVPMPRFLRLNYVVASAVFTGGTFMSELVGTRFDDIVNPATGAFSGGRPGFTVPN
jgi:hypothetical protein